ncbi:hypothetical protein DIPPA_28889 [Diplonema papillatum]|nr:hypothetical protein DIPPA_28889 [Diplonema papillatum]
MQDALKQAEWLWTSSSTIGYTNEIRQQAAYRVSEATGKQTEIMLHDLRRHCVASRWQAWKI